MTMIYLLTAVLVFLVIVITGMALMASQQAEQRARAARVVSGTAETNSRKSSGDSRDKRRAELAKKLNEGSGDEAESRTGVIRQKMREAGLAPDLRKYWIATLLLAALTAGIAYFSGFSLFVTMMAGLIGFFGLPRLILRMLAKRRQKKFLEEFADALESVVRLLKAGMPVSEAIAMIGREFSGPVGEEMAYVYDQQRVGISLPDAVISAATRMPLTEMQMFATGVAIQQQTGASLSEVLQNLAGVIRSRHKLKRKVEAITSEAKASATIIGILPLVVAGGLYALNPEYMRVLFTTPLGKLYLTGAAIWMGIGILIMRQMINFKV